MAAPTKTLQNLRNVYYAILKEDEDSSAYPLVLTDVLLNNSQNGICSGNLTDLTTARKEQIEKAALPFIFGDKYYSSVQDTYTSDNLVVGATEIQANNTDDFADSGYLWINEDIVEYTGKTSTSFTGVTGVDFPHTGGSRISQLFQLPDDYASPVRVIYNNQITLKPVDYRNLYQNLNNYKGNYGVNNVNNANTTIERFPSDIRPFYVIINGEFILPFQIDNSSNMIHMIYEKNPTTLVNGSDLVTIPDRYSESTIPFIAAADTLYHRGEEDRALKLLNFGLGKVMEMYSYYSDNNNEELNNQRIETGKDQIFNI